jgi:hypothetical protein
MTNRRPIIKPFDKVRSKPLLYAGELSPTPERVHYLTCYPLDKDELYHLRIRASLRNEPEPKAVWKIHFYCYTLPDMGHREILLFFRKDFSISPLIQPAYLAETCTEFLYSQVIQVAKGILPPRIKATARNLLLPGVLGEQHWRAVVNTALNREIQRMPAK